MMGVAYASNEGTVRIDAAATYSPNDAKVFADKITREADKAIENTKGIAAVVKGSFSGNIYLVKDFKKVDEERIKGDYVILKRSWMGGPDPVNGYATKNVTIQYEIK